MFAAAAAAVTAAEDASASVAEDRSIDETKQLSRKQTNVGREPDYTREISQETDDAEVASSSPTSPPQGEPWHKLTGAAQASQHAASPSMEAAASPDAGAFRSAVLAHKATVKRHQRTAERESSLSRKPSLTALHENATSPTVAVINGADGEAAASNAQTNKPGSAAAWRNAAALVTRGRLASSRDWQDEYGDQSKIQDSAMSGVGPGKSFYELTKEAAVQSGGDFSKTLLRSSTLRDVSHHNSASHLIPKVGGGWKKTAPAGHRVKTDEVLAMPRFMIHPFNPWYRAFLMVTVFFAAASGFITPWVVAFQDSPGLCPYKDFPAVFEYLAAIVFATDIVLSFFVAHYDQEVLITDRRLIARHYLKFRFWVDIIAWIPFDYTIIEAAWPPCYASNTTRYVSLLNLLRLLRMYRVLLFFKVLEYNLAVGLLVVTLARNFVYIIYTCHWAGCLFYFTARQEGVTAGTWLGMYPDLLKAWPNKFDRYVFSLYWAVTTTATVGYGDFHAASMPEAIINLCFMLFIIGYNAYIVGTITLVVMKSDERTGHYRTQQSNLRQYSKVNHVPKSLQESMQEHLRLHFNNQEASDEQVLSIYPTTIRRRILRHLYLQALKNCYLFKDCKQKYLDALLSVARVELFMPGVDITAEGDHVNELMIVVGGLVEVVRPSQKANTANFRREDDSANGGAFSKEDSSVHLDSDGRSIHLGSRQLLGDGDAIAEVAFYTEIVQMQSIRSITVAKVLTIPRQHYNEVSNSYPIGARTTLENLGEHAEQMVQREFSGVDGSKKLLDSLPSTLRYKGCSADAEVAEVARRPGLYHNSMALTRTALSEAGLAPAQQQAVASVLRVRSLVVQHIAKQDEQKTTDFLYAASKGDDIKCRQMLRQGFAVDTSDYDGRTALMLAAGKGHADVLHSLLAAGCNPHLSDKLGGNAMLEACKAGHDNIIQILKENGAKLHMSRIDAASQLCAMVFKSDLPLLKRFILAGIEVDAGDYDNRTALHIAACECNLTAVRLLVEEGDADVWVRDRWRHTPHDEAQRVGARHVARYLQAKMAERLDPGQQPGEG